MKNYGKSSLNYPFCSLSEALNYINLFDSVSDYLLSNNHINAIIVHKFDFSDEEVCILFPVNILVPSTVSVMDYLAPEWVLYRCQMSGSSCSKR